MITDSLHKIQTTNTISKTVWGSVNEGWDSNSRTNGDIDLKSPFFVYSDFLLTHMTFNSRQTVVNRSILILQSASLSKNVNSDKLCYEGGQDS